MFILILTIGIIAAVLMIAIVLIQNPKGGGLASNFSSSNQIFGVKRTSEGVEKLTWIFAIAILVVSLGASSYNGDKSGKDKNFTDPSIEKYMETKPSKTTAPKK